MVRSHARAQSMNQITDQELIKQATSVIKSRKMRDYIVGDVGCALVTEKGNVYVGVCIDTGSSMGFCAEHNAIGSMVTAGESEIKKIVAVWKDQKGTAYILTPCGRCREFIRQIDNANLETEVIIAENKNVTLKDLLPYHDSWKEIRSI